jgi:hypothetical protein
MSIIQVSVCAAVLAALGVAVYVWNDRLRHVPLADFGLEAVQRIGTWESPNWRERVWSRGWMTSAEWCAVNKRQIAAIDAELKRRGITPND